MTASFYSEEYELLHYGQAGVVSSGLEARQVDKSIKTVYISRHIPLNNVIIIIWLY